MDILCPFCQKKTAKISAFQECFMKLNLAVGQDYFSLSKSESRYNRAGHHAHYMRTLCHGQLWITMYNYCSCDVADFWENSDFET